MGAEGKNSEVAVKTEENEYGLQNEAAEKLRGEDGKKDAQVIPRQTYQG